MTLKEEVTEIWSILKTFSKGMEDFNKKLDTILAYHTLRAEIEEIVEEKVKEELKELGFGEPKDFANHSKFIA